MYDRIRKAVDRTWSEDRRRIFLVGLAKHTEVLSRYKLALSLARVLRDGDPVFVPVPKGIQLKVYKWPEFVWTPEDDRIGQEPAKFAIGDMFFVRFGPRVHDPVWTVDILSFQKSSAHEIFAYLLSDAVEGFPIPFYPRCLQSAHEYAEIVDFDLDILQDQTVDAIRALVDDRQKEVIDALRLSVDLAGRRYG